MTIAIDLTGLTALVTGASQGIGAETARALHSAGARVILNHPDSAGGKTEADASALAEEPRGTAPRARSSRPPTSAIPRRSSR